MKCLLVFILLGSSNAFSSWPGKLSAALETRHDPLFALSPRARRPSFALFASSSSPDDEPAKPPGAIAQTLRGLPAQTSLGLAVGSLGLLGTVFHALSGPSSEVLQTSQSREDLLALFSSIYLLTLCVSEIDFSAINRERILREKEVQMSSRLLWPEAASDKGFFAPSDLLLDFEGEGSKAVSWSFRGSKIEARGEYFDVLSELFGPNLSLSVIGWDAR